MAALEAASSTSASTVPRAGPSSSASQPISDLLQDGSRTKLLKQGAEAKVYRSWIFSQDPDEVTYPDEEDLRSGDAQTSRASPTVPRAVLLKFRFPKTYRHPTLSAQLTAQRTAMEARSLLRCAKANISVPGVRCVDEQMGVLGIDWVDGRSVREWLGGGAEGDDDAGDADADEAEDERQVAVEEEQEEVLDESQQRQLMLLIGQELAKMHSIHVIHGDLTTSNMMLVRPEDATESKRSASETSRAQRADGSQNRIVLIDFGLASVSSMPEDKAVDLYVLERAFASTHPGSEHLFALILDAYFEHLSQAAAVPLPVTASKKGGGKKGSAAVLTSNRSGKAQVAEIRRKLDEVRMRGRKRSMVG